MSSIQLPSLVQEPTSSLNVYGWSAAWPWPWTHDLENVINITWTRWWIIMTSFVEICPCIHAV